MTVIAEKTESKPGIIRAALNDEGVQRSLAGVVVAVVVAGARKLIFKV